MIDRAPQVHMPAGDPDDHFVEMPAITWSRTAPPQSPGDRRSEFEHPTANALVGDVEPTLGKQILHIAIAQSEPEVQPDRVLDDDRRKAMPAIGDRNHDRTLPPDPPSSQPVTLTKPSIHITSGCPVIERDRPTCNGMIFWVRPLRFLRQRGCCSPIRGHDEIGCSTWL